ncbi:MAG TPA: hypothetical protein EYH54_01725 [Nautiliaceae bacterium]|nr:hypothetical protein [Nautiliaceae bacterium]
MKKSNVVAFSIFLFVMLSIILKYFVIKFDIKKYGVLWEENKEYLKKLKERCFFIEKAFFYGLNNKKYLLIKMPNEYSVNLGENFLILEDGLYFIKVVNKIYLDNRELFGSNFLLMNSKICVE